MKCGMSRTRHMDGVLESVSAKLKDIGVRFGKQLRTFGVGRTILLIIGKVLKWYNILAGAKDAVVCIKIKNDLNNAYKWADKLGGIPHDSLSGGGNYFSKTTAFEAIHGEINISLIIQMLKRLIGVGLGIAIEKASQFGRNDSKRIADGFKQAEVNTMRYYIRRRYNDGISDIASRIKTKFMEYINYLKSIPRAKAVVSILFKVIKISSEISMAVNAAVLAKDLKVLYTSKKDLEMSFVPDRFAEAADDEIPMIGAYQAGMREAWLKAGKRIIIGLIGTLIGYVSEALLERKTKGRLT